MGRKIVKKRNLIAVIFISMILMILFVYLILNPKVEFEDVAFKQALSKALSKETIRKRDLLKINELIIVGNDVAVVNSDKEYQITTDGCIIDGHEMTSVGDITALDDIVNLPNLQTLTVIGQQIEKLPDIESESLTRICIAHNGITDISSLSKLEKLSELDLSYNMIIDMSGFSCGKNLQSLYLSGNAISNLSFFNGTSNKTLQNLKLDNNILNDIMPLEYLIGLKTLDLSNNEIENIQTVAASRGMTKLNISGNQIFSIDIISIMDELTELDASFNKIDRLYNVYEGVEKISFSGNAFKDVFEAKWFPDIVEMNLDFNQITDISGLSACRKLQKLSISYNKISDLSMFAFDNNISYLDLSGNKFGSMDVLTKWGKGLKELNISDTNVNVSDAFGLAELKQLKTIFAFSVANVEAIQETLPNIEIVE